MLDLPGLMSSGELKQDVEQVRRYLARLVPQLDQALSNLSTDNFTSDYNALVKGVTDETSANAAEAKTTSEAIARHMRDYENPHHVTLEGLGYTPPHVLTFWETEHGWAAVIGQGLTIQCKKISLEAGTATGYGSCYYRDVVLGDWDVPTEALYGVYISVTAPNLSKAGWCGTVSGASETSAGTARMLYAMSDAQAQEITVYGIGGVSDGD